MTNGCNRLFDSYRFLSSSLDSLVKILLNIFHKFFKNLKKEIVGDDNLLKIVNEIEKLTSVDRTIEDIKKDFPDEIEN